jgi:hypothetical protein
LIPDFIGLAKLCPFYKKALPKWVWKSSE